MATRARDPKHGHNHSNNHNHSKSTRNKENIPHGPSPSPSPSPVPSHGRPFRPSLVKSPDKQPEFWTDSFLGNNASQTSLIPSPQPSTAAISKPRRTIRPQTSIQALHRPPRHRQTQSELPATRLEDFKKSYQKPLARGTSPIRSTGLSTPPRSREGSVAESPNQILSSPPQALTDTYSRIDQEEDLAATEGEISDSDSGSARGEHVPVVDGPLISERPSSGPLRRMSNSRASTPTNQIPQHRLSHDENPTIASVFSDPTGMSFVDQLSDPGLRNTLTPHMLQSAADRDALYRAWQSRKLIAFGKAGKVILDADDVAESISSSPRQRPERVIAFSKAGKIKLASDHLLRPQHQRTFSDVTEQLDRASNDQPRPIHNDNWHNDDLRREAMPHNPRVHREPYFPRNHGFPERNADLGQDGKQSDGITGSIRKARSESPFTSTSRPTTGADRIRQERSEQIHSSTHARPAVEALDHRSDADATLDSPLTTQTSSDIWAQEAADRPLESIEHDPQPRKQRRQSDSHELQISPEKSRRLDLDFTGQSFQVSESPPVRGRNVAQARDREIRGLAQQAVTTNRLSQLRARESQEKLRQRSGSPLSEAGDRYTPERKASIARDSDTASVIYRTSSNGSGPITSKPPTATLTPDSARSHDILQRLARGSSSTPRSSTPSDRTINGTVIHGENKTDVKSQDVQERPSSNDSRRSSEENRRPGPSMVQATPKVTGAWTDTILPDTVKTMKKNIQNSRYAQTPHVSAGGWIDTPAPNAQPVKLEPVQEVTQEIPEELMNGIAKDSASDRTLLADEQPSSSAAPNSSQAIESLARKVLSEAKEKDNQEEEQHPNADNSLVLGNATLQSLQNVLDMDDTTMLSQLSVGEGLGQSDTEVLDRLGTKLGRLQTHIHDARKGITKLEHQMSQPQESETTQAVLTTAGTSKSTSTSFPFGIFTLSIPIPILYRRRKNTQYLPRPTPLGWIVLAFWAWYLLECTLAEIYSHPTYAERYTWPAQREPEYPFVLPTMLWRWSHLESLIRPLQVFFMGVVRMVGMWFGVTDGFTDGPVGAGAVVSPQVQMEEMQEQGQHMGMDRGFDMINDEYL